MSRILTLLLASCLLEYQQDPIGGKAASVKEDELGYRERAPPGDKVINRNGGVCNLQPALMRKEEGVF